MATPLEMCLSWAVICMFVLLSPAASQLASSERCSLTKGDWCQLYLEQKPIAVTAAPQGSKTCEMDCNKRGNCNADTGICDCMLGWTGADCTTRQLRPCTNRHRTTGAEPASHVGPDGLDLNLVENGWTASRCAGWCDIERATCWCPPSTKFGYIPPPEGSPPGTPPVKIGRMLMDCPPGTDSKGQRLAWGRPAMPWEDLMGPNGYCEKQDAVPVCGGCTLDGVTTDCSGANEPWCPNQCSGHGTCLSGWCACHEGYYGHDCARPVKGRPFSAGLETERPWLWNLVQQPVEVQPKPKPETRLRPLIYVYDLPPDYNTRMRQYANSREVCGWRWFDDRNGTVITRGWTYAIEQLLHELLLQSEHRTFNPEEADFFYVPVWSSCYSWPVFGWADAPWFHTPDAIHRAAAMSRMNLDAKRWVQQTFPYWDRNGGTDHIFLFSHDEGACWAPTELWPAIILTHWGRMDKDHKSNTAYGADDYNFEVTNPEYDPESFLQQIKGHPCYDPAKDLVIPAFKGPHAYADSPQLSANPLGQKRDILLMLRGDVGKHRLPNYSRGIRQKLYKLWKEQKWAEKHNIQIGAYEDVPGDYNNLLSRSKYCIAAPGDGWSPRVEDAVLSGCVPVIIKDGVHDVFESILELEQFSVRVPEADIEKLPEILGKITDEKLKEMQQKLHQVWHRFAWTSHQVLRKALTEVFAGRRPELEPEQREAALGPMLKDDAFGTVMQWLASRMKSTATS